MADEPNGTENTETTDPATQGTETTEPTGADELDPAALKAELDKWKSLARKHETNAKSNSEAAKRLAAIEDAQKTAEQKLQEQLAATQAELAAQKVEVVRRDAAAKAGLPADLIEYITASDPDEAEAQAKRLAERLAPAPPPVADMRQGSRSNPQRQESMDDWFRRQTGRGN